MYYIVVKIHQYARIVRPAGNGPVGREYTKTEYRSRLAATRIVRAIVNAYFARSRRADPSVCALSKVIEKNNNEQ